MYKSKSNTPSVIVPGVGKETRHIGRSAPVQGTAEGNFSEVRVGTDKEIRDIDHIGVTLLCPGFTPDLGDYHFELSSVTLFRGAALHVMHVKGPHATFKDVLVLLASKPLKELCAELQCFDHAQGREFYWTKDSKTGEPVATHPVVKEVFRRLGDRGDNEAGGVKATLESALAPFTYPT